MSLRPDADGNLIGRPPEGFDLVFHDGNQEPFEWQSDIALLAHEVVSAVTELANTAARKPSSILAILATRDASRAQLSAATERLPHDVDFGVDALIRSGIIYSDGDHLSVRR